jgi:hypothetical protein
LLQQAEGAENGQLPTEMRAVLKNCTNFADADRKLAESGISSGGKRRALIARHSPRLYNESMKTPFTG